MTAREAFRKTIERSPRFPGVHARYGVTYLAKGDFQTGIRELLKEESLHPESPDAYLILGGIYQSHGNKSAAIEQWKSAVKHDPDNRASHETLCRLLHEEKRYEEAVHHLEKALKRDPENAEDTLWLAEAYARTGRTRQAASLAQKAVTLCETPEFLARAARVLVDTEQPLDQAKAWNDKAGPLLDAQSLAIGDDDQKGLSTTSALLMVWETKGRILMQEGHPEAALPYLKSVWSLSLSGSCGDLLAQAYERLGRKEDAARQYELATVATGADREGIARRYWKLTGNAMPDRMDRSRKSSNQLIAFTYKLIELRTGHFPNATSFGTLKAVVVVTPKGIEQVHLGKRSDELGEYIEAAKSLRLHIEFPDATPRQIYLQGGMEFKRTGGTFIFVVP
jgi:tetratricopeptide (TPR) repeat protein